MPRARLTGRRRVQTFTGGALTRALHTLADLDMPAKRLDWILELVNTDDLIAAHPRRHDRATIGFVLRLLQPADFRGRRAPGSSMADPVLLAIQRQLRAGFDALAHGRPWLLPAAELVLTPTAPGVYEQALVAPDSDQARVLLAVAALVRTAGLRLRQCAEPTCRRFFIPTKRQTFHTTRCRQKSSNRRRR